MRVAVEVAVCPSMPTHKNVTLLALFPDEILYWHCFYKFLQLLILGLDHNLHLSECFAEGHLEVIRKDVQSLVQLRLENKLRHRSLACDWVLDKLGWFE